MLRFSLGQPGRSACVCVEYAQLDTRRHRKLKQLASLLILLPPHCLPPRQLPLVLPLLTPPIAIFTLCTCKRNCTNGIISCFLPLPRREAASHFVLFCLSFWFAFVLDSFNFSYSTPRPVQIQQRQQQQQPALPAFHLSLSHSRSLLFSRLRALSVTAKSKQRKAHVVSRQSPSTSTSSSSPQNEQNFFVFLWGVSNNFWLIELLIKLIEMQREAATATATTLVNKNNVDWIKYFKAYCTGSKSERERERERETELREGYKESKTK